MVTLRLLACHCLLGLALLALVGCVPGDTDNVAEAPSLPVVSGSGLSSFVDQSEVPVLVEFGVDYQCERCSTMRRDIVALGEKFEGRAKVVRVDFTSNARMVAELGGTICPTYVYFDGGKPVRTQNFPVSVDMLESGLENIIQ